MDTVVSIAPLVGALLSLSIGAVGLLRPQIIATGAGVIAEGPHGISELRALLGGVLFSLGLVCLITREPAAFLAAAAAWLGAAVAKLISLVLDRPEPGKVVPGLVLDALIGFALLAGHTAV